MTRPLNSEHHVRVSGIRKAFGPSDQQVLVLDGVDFSLAKGEISSIVGQSGSGKTTLLSLLAGLDQPDSGTIHVGEKNLNNLAPKDLINFRGRSIGVVFQTFHLVPFLTALENVALPLQIQGNTEALVRAKELMIAVGLESRLDHLPSQLSGGECQRVAIARALVISPELLLADEPSGNLDTATGEKVMRLFFELVGKSQTTTLLVTHNTELAQSCQSCYQMERGQLSPIKIFSRTM